MAMLMHAGAALPRAQRHARRTGHGRHRRCPQFKKVQSKIARCQTKLSRLDHNDIRDQRQIQDLTARIWMLERELAIGMQVCPALEGILSPV